jgi:hypothetical protein
MIDGKRSNFREQLFQEIGSYTNVFHLIEWLVSVLLGQLAVRIR